MRNLLAVVCGLAILSLTQTPAAAAEEIFCGKILGSSAPTATAPGSFVIPQPGDRAPAGTYIGVAAGTQFSYERPLVWVCVRATLGGPVVPVPGSPSGTTHTFVAFVTPGSPGYRAEPAAAPSPIGSPGTGGVAAPSLPSTSTEAAASPRPALFVFALLALGGSYALRRRRTAR